MSVQNLFTPKFNNSLIPKYKIIILDVVSEEINFGVFLTLIYTIFAKNIS